MTALLRWPVFRYGLFIVIAVAATFLLIPDFFRRILSAEGFMPHATCYLRNPRMIWLHATSDTVIGTAYLAISSTLAWLVFRARRDIPFHWMFLAFGLFIVTCGFTHFMELWTVWQPYYWLAGYIKLVTAVASLATAIVLPPVVPKVIDLIRAAKLSEQRKSQLEEANRELEALYRRVKDLDQLKSQFFANVSHELRTPLTLILSPVQRIQSDSNITSSQRRDLQTVERNAKVLLRHVNELLDAAKLEAGRMELQYSRGDLATLVRSGAAQFESSARARNMDYQLAIPEHLEAELDFPKAERVLLNLLSNAFKFTPDNRLIRVELTESNGRAILRVEDSGPGIPADMRDAIFERFRQVDSSSTRKHGGIGLGLAISREMLDLLRGAIRVQDRPQGGSIFIVEIPLRAPAGTKTGEEIELFSAAEASLYVAETEPLSRGAGTPVAPAAERPAVLIAEDNRELNDFISAALSSDYQVLRAFNGQEALAAIETSPPDVVLSDVMMPGMSGDELLQRLRSNERFENLPVILLTARADEEFKVRMLRAGAQDFLAKPFSLEELRARVSNLVAISRSRRMLEESLQSRGGNIVALVNEALHRKEQAENATLQAEKARAQLKELADTLEKRVQERTAELQEANDELKAFTSSVSHDLRAPLRTMRGMADVLLETLGESGDPEVRHYAMRIVHGAQKMDTLLDDLLTYSRLGRGELFLEPVNLEEIVTQVLQELEADILERGAVIAREGALPRVKGNHTLLKQIVSNLLSNALKYVPRERKPRVRIWAEHNGTVKLFVQDNGLGIAREYYQMIFEPFKRLHSDSVYPGTGLGLAIALKAARRMGGNMGVESRLNEGSTFWVELLKP